MSTDTLNIDGVTVTERAARRIGEILSHEPQGTMLRVSVEGGGCSGFQYRFDMERTQAEDDVHQQSAGEDILRLRHQLLALSHP
jgi:iron-sulfur cluster assembly accessory protein